MKNSFKKFLTLTLLVTIAMPALAKFVPNYDESKADIYKKLDTLDRIGGGGKIANALEWETQERPKVIAFLENEYFGKLPPRAKKTEFKLVESSDDALDGKALRRQYEIISQDANGTHKFDVLIYIPKNAKRPTPVFVNANFSGNHTTTDEPQVRLAKCFLLNNPARYKISDNRAHDYQRGTAMDRHPMKDIIARGYAVATFCYCDVYPDYESRDGFNESVYKIFERNSIERHPRAIAAWAWGNSRVYDLIETMPELDSKRVCVIGHSRLGKTALVSSAYDPRFAMSVSNSSCCGGAATNRRNFGETLESATARFPNWYLPEMKKYAKNPEAMPIDQQHLIAATAPRPVYVTSGTLDLWADPRGEHFSLVEASKIYALYGAKELPSPKFPEPEKPFNGSTGYVLYKGKHDITPYIWECVMNFADKHGWNK